MENNINKFNQYCNLCDYKTSKPSDWIKHVDSEKHKRGGKRKEIKCDKCYYISSASHWLLKQHMLTQHSTKEERSKHKYYCSTCDYVFFSKLYLDKHINGKHHKIKVLAYNVIL